MPGHNQDTCAAHNYIRTIFRASIATYIRAKQYNTYTVFWIAIFGFSRAIQRASNGKSSLQCIYKDDYSNDLAYAVIRLIKITARNEKALTARGTAWKFLHGPKQILPGPGPGWSGCGYATGYIYPSCDDFDNALTPLLSLHAMNCLPPVLKAMLTILLSSRHSECIVNGCEML